MRAAACSLATLVFFAALSGCGDDAESGTGPSPGVGNGTSRGGSGGAAGTDARGGSGGTDARGGSGGSDARGGSGGIPQGGAGGGAGAGSTDAGAGSGGLSAAGGGTATGGSGGSSTGPGGKGGSSSGAGGAGGSGGASAAVSPTRGFPDTGPWAAFYGTADDMGDLDALAGTFRIFDIDVDPDVGNFTKAEIQKLRAGGKNRVLSYMNVGSCEDFRSYWDKVPSGFVSCKSNTKAHRGLYDGYPDETWMNLGDLDYQKLIVELVAQRLVDQGVDGFYLDNMEMVEHGTGTKNGPCDASCSQGGLDLVRKLRERFPDKLIVMQNATSDVTRLGTTGGVPFASLLDGIAHEEVYAPEYDSGAEEELLAWKQMALSVNGRPFWIATEDYVGSCSATAAAKKVYDKSKAKGFSPYATDESAGQTGGVCVWSFL